MQDPICFTMTLKSVLRCKNIRLTGTSVDGLVQDCSNSITDAIQLPQSCTKPSIYYQKFYKHCMDCCPQNTGVTLKRKCHHFNEIFITSCTDDVEMAATSSKCSSSFNFLIAINTQPIWIICTFLTKCSLQTLKGQIYILLLSDMMTSSNGSIFRVTGPLCREFTGHRSLASDAELWCLFDLYLNKLLSKQSWGCWFEPPWRPLWRHCNECPIAFILQEESGHFIPITDRIYTPGGKPKEI